ncbi:MAG: phosphatidylserine decarboxylase [Candidatus Methanospirareceae archaeon]
MVSPASGKIIGIEGRTISIFMHIYNIHTTVAPLDGVVKGIRYERGVFRPAFLKSSIFNEKNMIELGTRYGDVRILQIAGFFARRIRCDVKEGERVIRGQRIGKIYLGSRVDVDVPEGFEILVREGDKVRYGRTKIAEI